MSRSAAWALGSCIAIGLASGCNGDDEPGKKPTPSPTGDTAISATGDTGTIDAQCEVATWELAADPVLRTWCTPCHASSLTGEERSGAPAGMDFDSWELAAPFAQLIKSAAVPDDARMPPEGQASAEEREWLAKWVDCGALGEPDPPEPCDELLPAPAGSTDPCASGYNQAVDDLVAAPGADLSCLCAADGQLTVSDAEVHLPLLTRVGGDLVFTHTELLSITAPELRDVDGSLRIEDQAALHTVDLAHLHTVGGDVVVASSGTFPRFELQQLTNVGGDLRIEALPTAAQVWLPRVEVVGGTYVVADNPVLYELPFYFELMSVGGNLVVRDNPELTEVVLATQLETLGGGIEVGGNQLTTLSMTYSLTEVPGDIYVRDEPYLEYLAGLTDTLEVSGLIRLRNLPSLGIIEMLPQMETVGGIWYDELPALLDTVNTSTTLVAGDVVVTDSELQGVPYLGTVTEIGGDVELVNLPGLEALGAFGDMEIIDGDVLVENTAVKVAELPTLYRSGDLVLRNNPALEAVDMPVYLEARGSMIFQGLPEFIVFGFDTPELLISGDLVVDDLDALDDLTRLHVVDTLVGDLIIQNNAGLDASDVTALVGAIENHSGAVIAQDNG